MRTRTERRVICISVYDVILSLSHHFEFGFYTSPFCCCSFCLCLFLELFKLFIKKMSLPSVHTQLKEDKRTARCVREEDKPKKKKRRDRCTEASKRAVATTQMKKQTRTDATDTKVI